jgi:hypothetical protein
MDCRYKIPAIFALRSIGSLSSAAKYRAMERKSQNFSAISEQLPSEFSSLVFLAQPHFNKLSGFDKLPLCMVRSNAA